MNTAKMISTDLSPAKGIETAGPSDKSWLQPWFTRMLVGRTCRSAGANRVTQPIFVRGGLADGPSPADQQVRLTSLGSSIRHSSFVIRHLSVSIRGYLCRP